MPNKKRNDEKPESTHEKKEFNNRKRQWDIIFHELFVCIINSFDMCQRMRWEGRGKATQEKVLSFSEARKWIYIPNRGKESNFPHLALCEGSVSDEASTKRRKTIERSFPTTCAWKGEICCRRERWINLMPFNIGYCLCCCCCYLIKFWSFSRRMSLMARVFASAQTQSHQVNKV